MSDYCVHRKNPPCIQCDSTPAAEAPSTESTPLAGPREWTIQWDRQWMRWQFISWKPGIYPDALISLPFVYVVEASALRELQAENEKLRAERDELQLVIEKYGHIELTQKLANELAEAKREIERLKEQVERDIGSSAFDDVVAERDAAVQMLDRERDIWHDLHNGMNAKLESAVQMAERLGGAMTDAHKCLDDAWHGVDSMPIGVWESAAHMEVALVEFEAWKAKK